MPFGFGKSSNSSHGNHHEGPNDTFHDTQEAALLEAFKAIDTVVGGAEVIGREMIIGKFVHNRGKHIGGNTKYSDHYGNDISAQIRQDNETDAQSYDWTVQYNGTDVARGHARWPRR